MAVVSHFDTDHINGLEQLLLTNRVRSLVLPYASFRQRLATIASAHSNMEPMSPQLAAFSIDPVGYLEGRGLLEQIDNIVFVAGGEPGARDGGGSLDPRLSEGETATRWSSTWNDPQYVRDSRSSSGEVQYGVLPHNAPVVLPQFQWEFSFFNAALPDEKASRSRTSIAVIQAEVSGILRRNRVLSNDAKPKKDWRLELKRCYTKHFGNSGPERNNISLCVLARPIGGVDITPTRPYWTISRDTVPRTRITANPLFTPTT